MKDDRINSVKGMFNRNQKKTPKKKKPKRYRAADKQRAKPKNINPFGNSNLKQNNLPKQGQRQAPVQNQTELSPMDNVIKQRMQEIEKAVGKLVADVQYLDSKNPVVSSQMRKNLIELITTLWTIGKIAKNYQDNNQLSVVNNYLSKQEKGLMNMIENPKYDSVRISNELNEVKMCQKIIKDSLRPNNSIVEYYNVLMHKLSGWGFEIKDPIGQKYDAHMDINVIFFEEGDPNLKALTITETKKPEIYLNGNKILKAEVIVSRPGSKE